MHKGRKRVDPNRPKFDQREYARYLRGKTAVAKLVEPCNLQLMVKLVRHSLYYGERAYEDMRQAETQKKCLLKRAIDGLHAAAEILRRYGQTEDADQIEDAARCELYESRFSEMLTELKSDPFPSGKAMGVFGGRKLDGATLFQFCLRLHIAEKIGRKPLPSEMAHILSALYMGFGEYPKEGIHPLSLDTKLNRYRKLKVIYPYIEAAIRNTKEQDLRYAKTPT